VKPGREADFKTVEEDAARICAELRFPHSHLAIESLSGPTEVWWLNAFESEEDRQRVADDYGKNPTLKAALEGITRRKEGLTETPMNVYATYRAELSRGASWKVAGARFFVVTISAGDSRMEGAVFEAPDGTRFVFRPFATRPQADAVAAAAGQIHASAHRPGPRLCLVSVPVPRVGALDGVRDQRLDGLADQVAPWVVEQLLGLGVDRRDPALAVHADHGIGCRLEQVCECPVHGLCHATSRAWSGVVT